MKPDINESQIHKPVILNNKTGLDRKALEERELLKALIDARNEWLDAVTSFEYAYEENLVDYCTYKMKACEARYSYFIKKARESGLKAALPQDADSISTFNMK